MKFIGEKSAVGVLKILSIFFNSKTYDLAGWKTIDVYQKEVVFQINNLEKNINIDEKRFKLPPLN